MSEMLPLQSHLRKDPEYLKKWMHRQWDKLKGKKEEPGEAAAFDNIRRQDGTVEAERVIGKK